MSCLSGARQREVDRDSLLVEKLIQFTSRFHNIRYPAIIDVNGDMLTPLANIDDFPPEYTAYIFTMKNLAEKVLKIFCSSNCRKFKARGENKAVFNLYCVDENHVLVFYCDIDPDTSKAVDPTFNDEYFPNVLAEIKQILASADVV